MSSKLSHQSANMEAAKPLATVSVREISNRLTSIKLSAGMIAAKTRNDDMEKYLRIISASADKIDRMIKGCGIPGTKEL